MVFKESKMGRGYEFGQRLLVYLFLGDHHSISIIASNFAGCKPNSIYFRQRCRFLNPLDGSVYVFSLNDKTVVICYMFTQL